MHDRMHLPLPMSNPGNKSNTLLLIFAFILLTSLIHGITHNLIESSCATTLYPDVCYSTLSTTKNLTTNKDVIQLSINKTKETILRNFDTIKKLTAKPNLTKRSKIALHDCLEMADETLEELDMVMRELDAYYPAKKSLRQHADDLKTLMSTTITNKETCLDGLSHDEACKRLRKSIKQGQDLGGKMCSNVLAMITHMTDRDMAKKSNVRKLKEEEKLRMWPKWLSRKDRKLLWAKVVTPNVTVAKDGKGNFTTVAQAVEAAPWQSNTSSRYVIKIGAGVYKENVEIPKKKNNLMFIGDENNKTIITGNRSVVGGTTTFKSATVAVVGDGFLARDITFENTAGAAGHQAVALRVSSDYSAFYRCSMLAYQDTLYALSKRQLYVNCLIVGTVDFIFGNAASIFQFCDILARRPDPNQRNMVTAQGRKDPHQNTGIVIQKCKIGATSDLEAVKTKFKTYLGRPWKNFSRTVVMGSLISDVIDPEGWHPWKGDFALNTLYYREYHNTGPGANTSRRVKWKGYGVMQSKIEVIPFTVGRFIDGWTWLLSTGFPFWPGW